MKNNLKRKKIIRKVLPVIAALKVVNLKLLIKSNQKERWKNLPFI